MINYYIFHGDTFYVTTTPVEMSKAQLPNTYMYSGWSKSWSRFYKPTGCGINWFWVDINDVPKEYRANLLLLT